MNEIEKKKNLNEKNEKKICKIPLYLKPPENRERKVGHTVIFDHV